MKDGKKRRPIVSAEELFLADEELKAGLSAVKKPLKKGKRKFNLHW
ncbi:MAG: hypothetical protein ACXV5I_06770 [Halobacteriota archaeon]